MSVAIYWCDQKDCANYQIVFEWDNADGPHCNSCTATLKSETKGGKK